MEDAIYYASNLFYFSHVYIYLYLPIIIYIIKKSIRFPVVYGRFEFFFDVFSVAGLFDACSLFFLLPFILLIRFFPSQIFVTHVLSFLFSSSFFLVGWNPSITATSICLPMHFLLQLIAKIYFTLIPHHFPIISSPFSHNFPFLNKGPTCCHLSLPL